MRIYGPTRTTSAETIRRHGELGLCGAASAEEAARRWTAAGFDDEMAERWLLARCFAPAAARELSDLGVTPEQAAARTRDGGDGSLDTIAHKVAAGDLSARQGAARSLSSR